jgi:hypothetical protein
MRLFAEPFVEKIREMPQECKSFLGELCAPPAQRVREWIDASLGNLRPELAQGIRARMSSMDNRRFFQGFAELATAQLLEQSGWTIDVAEGKGASLRAVSPSGGVPVHVMVLAFIQSQDPQGDPEALQRLKLSLGRVRSDLRFSVFVRQWLPSRFNPEPVRQAVDMWLQEVEAGRWDGHFASYEDEGVALEFSLSGERAGESQSPVVQLLGPFLTGRSVQRVEATVLRRLDAFRASAVGEEPILPVCVANRPWSLSRGYIREFLYGKPAWTRTDAAAEVPWEACLSQDKEPCLFKDPLYESLLGLMMVERDPMEPLKLTGRAYSNPFGKRALLEGEQPFPLLRESGREPDGAVRVSWS